MSCAKSGVPKKGANIPNVSAHKCRNIRNICSFLRKMYGTGRGGSEFFFFYYILRKFTKERTCPHTIDWQHGIEHAARRQMHLCCTASNRIFRRYEGLTRFSWAGGTSIYLHICNSRLSNCFPEHDGYIRCLIGEGRAYASIARLLSFRGLNSRT